MVSKTEQNKLDGDEWVQAIYSSPDVPFDEIYAQNDLSGDEVAVYEKYKAIIGSFLQLYKIRWSIKLLPDSDSRIKWLGRLLTVFESESVVGDKDQFIKKLFSKSLHTVCKANEDGFRIGTKSDEHDDILLELRVIELLVRNGFLVDLDRTDLPSGKRSEFSASNNSLIFHAEAKRLNAELLKETIWKHPEHKGKETFSLNDEQQRAIRKQFREQLKKAVKKFKNYSGHYLLVVDIHYPLGFLGNKLFQYVTNNFSPEKNCLGILMVESGQFKMYRNDGCDLNINEYINADTELG